MEVRRGRGIWAGTRALLGALGGLLAIDAACSGSSGGGGGVPPTESQPPAVALEPAFGGIRFSQPVKLVQHPSDDDRWYVVEQRGLVYTFDASNSDPATVAADVDALVNLGGANEQGLLGMAFDPSFASSGKIYFFYTDEDADTVVLDRWMSSDDGLNFSPDAIILEVPHPQGNHNAGDLAFGPDGFLYVTMGDGGSGNDPDDNGQNTTTLLGSILRLDVNGGSPYAIPPTNPFAANPVCTGGSGAAPCPEIFAWGFRNPWRFHFDPAAGDLWVGDVGQNAQEEIDRVANGGNYGWDCREGELDHSSFSNAPCDGPFEPPEAVHDRTEARAITGGAVYRGSAIPDLAGFYVYGDFVTRNFFTFDVERPDAPVLSLDLPPTSVSAFGQGRDGEIYVVGFGSPSIQKLVAAGE